MHRRAREAAAQGAEQPGEMLEAHVDLRFGGEGRQLVAQSPDVGVLDERQDGPVPVVVGRDVVIGDVDLVPVYRAGQPTDTEDGGAFALARAPSFSVSAPS